jgi:CRISPR type IV-associated protein Csf1
MCGWCAVLTGKDGLLQSARGVFSAAGVTPFGAWLAIKAALLEPPEPPFVALYATKNNQHMAWRAPISFSRDLFYVRVGEDSLLIRRPVLNQALDASTRLRGALDDHFQKRASASGAKPRAAADAAKLRAKSARRTVPHVFLKLSSDIKDTDHGVINPSLYKVEGVREGTLGDDLRLLENLTLGELWAMTFVTYLGSQEEPEKTTGDL